MTLYRVKSLKRAEQLRDAIRSQGQDAYVMQQQRGARLYCVMVRERD